MRSKHLLSLLAIYVAIFIAWKIPGGNWIHEKHKGYDLFYPSADRENKTEYINFIENGMSSVASFFNASFSKKFDVVIHSDRRSLDSAWQKDWNMPDFKSECWMVASGVATKLDMISPKKWDTEACEHLYKETSKTQKLITHELFHVFHGQLNVSSDFSNTDGIDWFVEGLATYASGQCDSLRIAEIKKAVSDHKIPKSLDDFWKGKMKYGLSGSVVMYIDHKYGRIKLKELLPLNKRSEIFSALKTTEPELLDEWKNFIQKL